MKKWYVFHSGQKTGPFNDSELQMWIKEKNLPLRTIQVLNNETNKWISADKIEFEEVEFDSSNVESNENLLFSDDSFSETNNFLEEKEQIYSVENSHNESKAKPNVLEELVTKEKFLFEEEEMLQETSFVNEKKEVGLIKEEDIDNKLPIDREVNTKIQNQKVSKTEVVGFAPWRRFFAWLFDMTLFMYFYILVGALENMGILTFSSNWSVFFYLSFLLIPMIYDTVFISFFGTTPGKFLLSLYVLNENGQKHSLLKTLSRSLVKLFRGHGVFIPLFFIVCNIVSYNSYQSDKRNSWDKDINGFVFARNLTTGKVLTFIIALIVLIFGFFLIIEML